MTEGNILSLLVRFSLPLLAGDLFQQLYNTVDTWVVGNYVSNTAFSAVGTVTPIVNILIGVFMGFSTGSSVVISQHFGAGDEERASRGVHTAMLVAFLLGIVLSLVGVAMTPLMLRLIKMPENVYPEALTYLRIYFAGLLGLIVYNMGSAVLRAVGNSRQPFYFLALCAVLNIVLDLVFVLCFHMGVAGVAWATIVAQFISAILVVFVLCRSEGCVHLELRRLVIHGRTLRRIVQIGIPTALQNSVTAFANVFTLSYINFFGSDVMGGYTAYNKLDTFIMLPVKSVSLAITTFVAQNIGAGELKRAEKGLRTALGFSFTVTGVIVVTICVWADDFVRFFIEDENIISYGVYFLRMLTPLMLFTNINQILPGAMRGAGNSRTPMFICLGSFVLFRQIYLYIMAHFICNKLTPIVLSFPAGWVLCSTIMILYYRRHPISRTAEKNLVLK